MPFSTSLHDVTPFRLRGLAFLSLSDTGTVLSRSLADNLGGGQVETFTQGTAVPCRVDPAGGREDLVAMRIDERTSHLIYVPAGTEVHARDRFAVTAGTFTRGSYEITAVRARTQEQVRVLEATEDF